MYVCLNKNLRKLLPLLKKEERKKVNFFPLCLSLAHSKPSLFQILHWRRKKYIDTTRLEVEAQSESYYLFMIVSVVRSHMCKIRNRCFCRQLEIQTAKCFRATTKNPTFIEYSNTSVLVYKKKFAFQFLINILW